MKPRLSLATALLAVFIPLRIHGEQRPDPPSAVASIPDSLAVPEFTPPAPVAPEVIPSMRIDAATTVPAAHGKTLTILRGEASTLLPAPLGRKPTPSCPATRPSGSVPTAAAATWSIRIPNPAHAESR